MCHLVEASFLKDCSSNDMYNWPLNSTDELLALSGVSYIGMKAFQMNVFAVVTLVVRVLLYSTSEEV